MAEAIAIGVCTAVQAGCCCGVEAGSLSGNFSVQGPSNNNISIGNVSLPGVTNGDGFVDEVVNAMQRRNYEVSGNPFSNFTNGGTWRS
jgi:hypothetical protein